MMMFYMSFFSILGTLFVLGEMYIYTMGIFVGAMLMVLVWGLSLTDCEMMTQMLKWDMVSYSLVILSIWVTILMYLSSTKIMNKGSGFYFFWCVFVLLLVLLLTFSSLNLLLFYFYFEVSLLPTLFIIMGWGYQPERIQAGTYFLFYTLTASLPLLGGLLWVYTSFGSLSSLYLSTMDSGFVLFYLFFVLAFLVKMPMFFVHLWLPKAHVEAPVAGSMILAGVLLKLGGYGLYRVIYGVKISNQSWGGYLFGLSIGGMLFVGLICCSLNDLKALVAYSSVAHMGLVICGYTSFSLWGYLGGLGMMLSHGLASSALFCAVNMYYERSGSRSFFLNSGLITYLPLLTLMFFMACGANMAAPPTLNLVSEVLLMGGMLKFDFLMLLLFPLGSYLGVVFTLFLYSFTQHGMFYYSKSSFSKGVFMEYFLFVLHLLPLNVLILNMNVFMDIF